MAVDILSTLNKNGSGLNLRDLTTSLVAAEIAPLVSAQEAKKKEKDINVCVIEKGGEVGMSAQLHPRPPVSFLQCWRAWNRQQPFPCAVPAGAHILSGNVFETRSLDELLPNWKEEGAPVTCQVIE